MATDNKSPPKPRRKKARRRVGELAAVDLPAEAAALDAEAERKRVENKLVVGVNVNEPERDLGMRLQAAREAVRLTQGELSDRTKLADRGGGGLSRVVISLYERGVNRPGPKEIRLLCEVLRVSPSYLIYGTDDPFDSLTERGRYARWAASNPEFIARLAYSFSQLHKHQRAAVMELMIGLLRGSHDNFDRDLDQHADQVFLTIADELRDLLAKRQKTLPK